MAKFSKDDEVKFKEGHKIHNYKMYINGYIDPSSKEAYRLWYDEDDKVKIRRYNEVILEKGVNSSD